MTAASSTGPTSGTAAGPGAAGWATAHSSPGGYDPRRLLLGDIDGDGLADLLYVEDRQVSLWINQSGNRWSETKVIRGTPPVTNATSLRLLDLPGSGIAGLLWSRAADGIAPEHALPRPHRWRQAVPAEPDGEQPRRRDRGGVPAVHPATICATSAAGKPAGRRRCRSRCTSWPGSR